MGSRFNPAAAGVAALPLDCLLPSTPPVAGVGTINRRIPGTTASAVFFDPSEIHRELPAQACWVRPATGKLLDPTQLDWRLVTFAV